jgi:hypothetical protein
MLKNVIESLRNNMENEFAQGSEQKLDSNLANKERLKIIKKFKNICKNERSLRNDNHWLNMRFLNLIFNAQFLLGLVSFAYMFCIVFTFFFSLYYEVNRPKE